MNACGSTHTISASLSLSFPHPRAPPSNPRAHPCPRRGSRSDLQVAGAELARVLKVRVRQLMRRRRPHLPPHTTSSSARARALSSDQYSQEWHGSVR
eukprot:2371148-Rhodomonas_salina.2